MYVRDCYIHKTIFNKKIIKKRLQLHNIFAVFLFFVPIFNNQYH